MAIAISCRRIISVLPVRTVFVTAAVLAIALGTPATSGQDPIRLTRSATAFAYDAAGGAAAVDRTWQIPLDGNVPMGLITAAAVCGDEAFLLDTRLRLVHKINLRDERRVGTFGNGNDADALRSPLGLAADCDAGRVLVVDHIGVKVFDAVSGELLQTFTRPATFVNAPGMATLDATKQSLYVQGLWSATRPGWDNKSLDGFFNGDWLGYALDLRTGAATPLVSAVEHGCWTSSPNCFVGLVEKVRAPARASWLAAHTIGTQIGVFDSSRRLLRTIDVRSPGFLEDGLRVIRRATTLETRFAWQERNSVIRALYSFDDLVVTIHSLNATKGWTRGHQMDFEVFMNIHRLDGAPIVSDVRLPDLPVARDEDYLYVIDYGPEGRRILGRAPISVRRIPIRGQWL